MIRSIALSLLATLIFCLVSCKSEQPTTAVDTSPSSTKYAANFSLQKKNGYTVLTVKQPYKNAEASLQYIAYPKGSAKPEGYEHATFIATPVQSIACLSTTHVGMLDFVDATDKLSAMSGTKFVNNKKVIKNIESGMIKELGSSENLDYELLLKLKPEIILTYSLGADNNSKKMKELGLKPVVIAEYLDNSPMGRAEWVKFLAVLLGKEAVTLKRFASIEQDYLKTMKLVQDLPKPTVFTGLGYEGNWHVPEGDSYVAKSISDAGGDYQWKDKRGNGSLVLDFEAVLSKAQQASAWINLGMVNSKADILAVDDRYGQFAAFKQGRIFNGNARISAGNGYDIYESAVVFPNIVLKDLITIFHPGVLPDHTLYYYKQLN